MKKNLPNLITIVVFIIIITVPQILSWINNENENVSITENRTLNKKPEFKLATITKYPKEFDDYYNDHLPFRTKLREVWTNINYDIFKTTIDNRVIIGKNDWLFYRADETIEQVQGITRYSEKEKKDILTSLKSNYDKLREKDIQMYILIIPNKENIYKEYLPNNIPIKSDISKAEDLIQYIRSNSDIKIVYPKEELMQAKSKYQVYRKYDTHWNKIGACIGTIAIQKSIDPKFLFSINEIEEIDNEDVKDLARFASLNKKLYEKTVRVKNFYPEIEYTRKENEQYEEYNTNSKNNKTVLFIGDSFREDMREYFSKLYKKVVYIHKDKYTESVIEKVNPDIVIFEVVERYSRALNQKIIK